MWAREDLVEKYATRDLRPAEVMLLVRYREALAGRVLELGCGAGRLTGYLAQLAESVHAIDVSHSMVARCRQLYPAVSVEQRDLDLSPLAAGASTSSWRRSACWTCSTTRTGAARSTRRGASCRRMAC